MSETDSGKGGYTHDMMGNCNAMIRNYPRFEDSCSADAGLGDLRCNISDPTQAPTSRPTRQPTAWPTAEGVTKRPTRLPSVAPTTSPSLRPSRAPTRRPIVPRPGTPTAHPTLSPTAETFLAAEYSQILNGMTTADFLDATGTQRSFERTVASAVGVNPSTISITNVSDTSSRRKSQIRQRKDSGIAVDYSVSVIIQDLDIQDFSEALSLIESLIAASVSEGDFLKRLAENTGANTSVFDNITISAPSFRGSHVSYLSAPPALSPTLFPTNSSVKSEGLPLYVFIAIGAAGLLLMVFVGVLVHFCLKSPPTYRQVKVSPRDPALVSS